MVPRDNVTESTPSTGAVCCSQHTYDRDHPGQQEVSLLLSEFYCVALTGTIECLGNDGALRKLTGDGQVLNAVRLSPAFLKAFLYRIPA
ncbi:hypothetical protein P153DRAFT_90107 [Dothidotthia symphoricarpi CBS 119687]|uniref:Uncharacterized protein n=1 Tax=Dothidotthia symphoricarpi CBS 119687 TaxID=1392245 RepID=A0A6A6A6R3_9PLEO|nr:uncharacterized protein P153DRAFT_90107 [Dothidotthia symphoricarpi CBS 119687]KAF2126311.1 hypothetical protein P153DRAFT_90107 [Dothidotthia symphoricarpi CBS 119687]